jgi:hypothetical protein
MASALPFSAAKLRFRDAIVDHVECRVHEEAIDSLEFAAFFCPRSPPAATACAGEQH